MNLDHVTSGRSTPKSWRACDVQPEDRTAVEVPENVNELNFPVE
jgi:hypothetical protein